jgi:LPXTG-motif cell wall-anchored protein
MTDADPLVSTEPLPNTGGEPLLVSMLGAMVAGGAFFMRRKVS